MQDYSALIHFFLIEGKANSAFECNEPLLCMVRLVQTRPERAASTLLQGIKKHLSAVKQEEEGYGPSL